MTNKLPDSQEQFFCKMREMQAATPPPTSTLASCVKSVCVLVENLFVIAAALALIFFFTGIGGCHNVGGWFPPKHDAPVVR